MSGKDNSKTRRSQRLREKDGSKQDIWSGVDDPEKIVRGQTSDENTVPDLPPLDVNPAVDFPGELTNYTQHTTPHSTQLTYLEETPTKDSPRTPSNEISRLSSIYTRPQGDLLNNTGEERIASELMNDNFHEILGSHEKSKQEHNDQEKFLSLDWVIPDGSNRTIHDVECKFANFPSPGGGQGAITLRLPDLQPFFETTRFLIDLDTAEIFALFRRRYVRTGMFCSKNKFDARAVEHYIQEKAKVWRTKFVDNSDTEKMVPRNLSTDFDKSGTPSPRKELPGLPKLPDPSIYMVKQEVLRLETRSNFIRERCRIAITYILAHEETENLIAEGRGRREEATQRLRILYGRVDAVKKAIDEGLQEDSKLRRQRNLPYLQDPKRFPNPDELYDANPKQWIDFMEEEAYMLYAEIEEAISIRDGLQQDTFRPLMIDDDTEVENTQNGRRHNSRNSNTDSSATSESSAQPTVVPINLKTPSNVEPLPRRSPKRDRRETHPKRSAQNQDGEPSKNNKETRASPHRHGKPNIDGQPSRNGPREEMNETLSNLGAAAPKTYGYQGFKKTETEQKTKTKGPFSDTELTLGNGGARAKQIYAPTKSFNNNKEYTQTQNNRHEDSSYSRPQKDEHALLEEEEILGIRTAQGSASMKTTAENTKRPDKSTQQPSVYYDRYKEEQEGTGRYNRNWRDKDNKEYKRRYSQNRDYPQSNRRDREQNYQRDQYQTRYQQRNGPYSQNWNERNNYEEEVWEEDWRQHRNRTEPRCTRCGNIGHLKEQCRTTKTYCEICKSWSHNRKACKLFRYLEANFPLVSSRLPTPEKVGERETPRKDPIRKISKETGTEVEDNRPIDGYPSRDTPETEDTGSKQKESRPDTIHQVETVNEAPPQVREEKDGQPSVQTEHAIRKPAAVTVQPQNSFTTTTQYTGHGETNQNTIPTALMQPNQPVQPTNYINPWSQQYGNWNIPYQQGMWPSVQGIPPPATDISKPPPPQPEIQKMEQEVNTTKVTKSDDVLTAIKEITQTMQKQQMYFEKRSVDNEGQMTSLVEALIKEQKKRDLDGLMSLIPIFKDSEPENCAEWISQVKNGCAQSGRHLRQELINKSETMVQTFIRNQGDIEDDELVDRLLTFFSDIPTPAHAAAKLRQIKQQENESVMKFNQRYKQYFERAEGELVDNVRSRLQMEMYLDALVAPVTHSIRQNIYYATKHAPKSLGEAMRKAEDGYMKEIYTRGEYNLAEDVAKKEVVCNEVNNGSDKGNTGFLRKQRYENQYTSGYSNRPQNQYLDTTDGQPSRTQWKYTETDKRQGNYQRAPVTEGQPSMRPQAAHNLPRGSLTHILVNPLNLDDTAFNAWLDRLVEARRNRINNMPRPYRKFRKPYNQEGSETTNPKKPTLRQGVKPAYEIEVDAIMNTFRCTYEDVEEANDMYNLDVEECSLA